jgi:hypothetical protein
MAEGFDVHLNEQLARRLKAAAKAAGMDPAAYAHQLLDVAVEDDFAEDDRRWAEYQRTGETVSVEEAFAAFDAEVKRVRTRKAG